MARIDELKKQNPGLNINLVDIINGLFEKTKYTEMTLNLYKSNQMKMTSGEFNEYVADLHTNYNIEKSKLIHLSPLEIKMLYRTLSDFGYQNFQILSKFVEYNEKNLIENKDLTSYTTFTELELQVSLSDVKALDKVLEKQILKLHEDDEWLVIKPLSFLSSRKYGSATKWCTTTEKEPQYYFKYSKRGILVYCINKKTGNKVAAFKNLNSEYDRETSFWNIVDVRVDSIDSDLPMEILKLIKNDFDTCKLTNWDLLTAEEQLNQDNWYNSYYGGLKELTDPVGLRVVRDEVETSENEIMEEETMGYEIMEEETMGYEELDTAILEELHWGATQLPSEEPRSERQRIDDGPMNSEPALRRG
jgi:hypothetical protein